MRTQDQLKIVPHEKPGETPSTTGASSKVIPFYRGNGIEPGMQLDFVCFSHLRWDFVVQRPQHLFTRCAKEHRVFFVEEPKGREVRPRWDLRSVTPHLTVCTPVLQIGASEVEDRKALARLMSELLVHYGIARFVAWYYTPMALAFSKHLRATVTVYDCMDELSLFRFAPASLKPWEGELMTRADLVFCGGRSLYEAKKALHPRVHVFPSSVDQHHFRRARVTQPTPEDQAGIPSPRLGYCGVIDERMDFELLWGIASAEPSWQIVLIGPVAKLHPCELPRRPNLHYLGIKPYHELPSYVAGWDLALIPFVRNPSTQFISPTKTPEYLAAGKCVVSTGIRDVIYPYGERQLVSIANSTSQFIEAAKREMARTPRERAEWLAQVDSYLSRLSWDRTWQRMRDRILERLREKEGAKALEWSTRHAHSFVTT